MKNSFAFDFRTSSEAVSDYQQIFTDRLSKLFSTCSGNKKKKQIFHKLFGFYVYSDFKRKLLRLLEISLCKVIKTDFFEFSRTFWWKITSWWTPICFCRVVIRRVSDFRQKMYRKVVKSNFYVFGKNFEETVFSETFLCVRYILGLWAYYFLNFGTNVSVNLWKLLPTPSDKHFDGKCLFKIFFFILSSNFERNNFWIRVEISEKASQNCILRVQKTFFRKRTSVEIFWFQCILGLGVKMFPNFGSSSSNLPKLLSKSSGKRFDEVFGKKSFFFSFWLKRLLKSGKNFTETLSKLISTCSENQLTKQIFSIFLTFLIHTPTSGEFFLWLLADKNSRKLVKTAFYRFREYTWMKNNSFWKILFRLTSELRAKLLLTVDKTFTERLSKLFSTCSGNKLKKQIFHNFFGFYVYSDFKRKLLWLLEIPFCKVTKPAFYEFSRTLWLKITSWWTPICFCRVVFRIVFDFRQKMYRKVVKINFYVFRKHFEETDFSETFFVSGTY